MLTKINALFVCLYSDLLFKLSFAGCNVRFLAIALTSGKYHVVCLKKIFTSISVRMISGSLYKQKLSVFKRGFLWFYLLIKLLFGFNWFKVWKLKYDSNAWLNRIWFRIVRFYREFAELFEKALYESWSKFHSTLLFWTLNGLISDLTLLFAD